MGGKPSTLIVLPVSEAHRTLLSVIEGFWTLIFSLCVLLWIDFIWFRRSNSHPCLLACTPQLLSPSLRLLTPVHTLLLHSLCFLTCCSTVFSLSSHSPLSPCVLCPCPVPAPVPFSPLPLLRWSSSHTTAASPSLLSSFRHISLGTIHTTSTFYGPNPFSHCVFTGLGAGIDLPLFVSLIASFPSLASLSLC